MLLATANSTGGVMGKMIDAQSIVVAAVATGQHNQEGPILRFVFWHSLVLAVLMGLLVLDDISLDSFTLAPESLTNDALMKSGARSQLAFKDIPPVLVQAITSIEDRRFFDHHGLDIFGVAGRCCATPATNAWARAAQRLLSNSSRILT